MTLDPEVEGIDVADVGEQAPPPFADVDEAELDRLEQEAGEDRPLSDEEQRVMLAGAWEALFGFGGWWTGAGQPIPLLRPAVDLPADLRASIEEAWAISEQTATRLARSTHSAMPRSWRDSPLLARLPIFVLVSQVGVLIRVRQGATQHLVEAYTRGQAPSPGAEPVPGGGGPAARAAGDVPPGGPESNGASVPEGSDYAPGLGLRGSVSKRAAQRRDRRRAPGAARDAE